LDSEPLSVSRTFYRKLKSLCVGLSAHRVVKNSRLLGNKILHFLIDCGLGLASDMTVLCHKNLVP